MVKLTASPAMIAGQAQQRDRKAQERPDVAEYENRADERRSAKAAAMARQREAFLSSPEGQAMLARREAMARAAAMLGKSDRWAEVDTFTAMVRGMRVEKGVVKALAPNVYVQRLHAPANGKGGPSPTPDSKGRRPAKGEGAEDWQKVRDAKAATRPAKNDAAPRRGSTPAAACHCTHHDAGSTQPAHAPPRHRDHRNRFCGRPVAALRRPEWKVGGRLDDVRQPRHRTIGPHGLLGRLAGRRRRRP